MLNIHDMPDRIVSSVELKEELEKVAPQKVFNTGMFHFDTLTKGFKEGDLVILSGLTGNGKCLGKGTPVLKYSGHIEKVEDIKVGDLLMGDDSSPRKVLSLTHGREQLYEITPKKGDSYIVNESHILSLVRTHRNNIKPDKDNGKIIDTSIGDYLKLSSGTRSTLKGYRVGVDFKSNSSIDFGVPPYLLGLWLGDGNSGYGSLYSADFEVVNYLREYANEHGLNCLEREQKNNKSIAILITGDRGNNGFYNFLKENLLIKNKHIPYQYKVSSRQDRLQLLAGLIDTDGYKATGYYEYVSKSKRLADDVVFLARSLGFASYFMKNKVIRGVTYYRISISGEVSEIPVKIWRKKAGHRNQIKNVLRTGISVKKIGMGDYYGFEIDGNKRFLLGDFTVTHNTEMAVTLAKKYIEQKNYPLFFSYEISSQELFERFGEPVPLFYLPRIISGFSDPTKWIEQKIVEAKKLSDIKFVFIDHLHYLVDFITTRNKNTSEMLGYMCREFKHIARRQRVVIVLLAHVRKFQSTRPNLQDIKDSSGIIQEADTVLIIHRTGKKRSRAAQNDGDEEYELDNSATLYVDKVRRSGGKLGNIKLELVEGGGFVEV